MGGFGAGRPGNRPKAIHRVPVAALNLPSDRSDRSMFIGTVRAQVIMLAHNGWYVCSGHVRLVRPATQPEGGLASVLLERLQQLELTDRICEQVDTYRDMGPVPRDDLYKLCRDNLELGLRSRVRLVHRICRRRGGRAGAAPHRVRRWLRY
jgi:hypothetical protein